MERKVDGFMMTMRSIEEVLDVVRLWTNVSPVDNNNPLPKPEPKEPIKRLVAIDSAA